MALARVIGAVCGDGWNLGFLKRGQIRRFAAWNVGFLLLCHRTLLSVVSLRGARSGDAGPGVRLHVRLIGFGEQIIHDLRKQAADVGDAAVLRRDLGSFQQEGQLCRRNFR